MNKLNMSHCLHVIYCLALLICNLQCCSCCSILIEPLYNSYNPSHLCGPFCIMPTMALSQAACKGIFPSAIGNVFFAIGLEKRRFSLPDDKTLLTEGLWVEYFYMLSAIPSQQVKTLALGIHGIASHTCIYLKFHALS